MQKVTNDSNENEKSKLKGTVAGVLSCAGFATSSMFIKMNSTFNGADVAVIRTFIMIVFSLTFFLFKRKNPFGYKRKMFKYLLIRAISSVVGVISSFSAVQFIPLPITTSLRYCSVFFTSILAFIVFKRKPSIFVCIGMCICVLGVTMVTDSSLFCSSCSNQTTIANTKQSYIGIGLSLVSALFQAVSYTVIEGMMTTNLLSNCTIIFNFSLISFVPTILVAVIWWVIAQTDYTSGNKLDILYVVLAGVFAYIAQYCLNVSVKHLNSSLSCIVRGFEIVFSFVYQATLFQLKSDFINYIGIGLIAVGVLVISTIDDIVKRVGNRFSK